MSDHQDGSDCRGLVTITTDGMEALSTNGTNQIVPADSPKKGHLFVLNTTVSPDGEMDIRRTLVDAGEAQEKDFDDSSEVDVPSTIPKENADIHEENQAHVEDKKEEAQSESKEVVEVHETQDLAEVKTEVEESQPETPQPDDTTVEPQHEAEVKPEAQDKNASEEVTEAKPEVPEEQAESRIEANELAEVYEIPQNGDVEEKPEKSIETPEVKVKRTMTLPWQKKRANDEPPKQAKPMKSQVKSESTGVNALSGVMKNLKKGFKIKVGGLGKSEDAAPGRIPQKSGTRPSPRIVSSLNITPTHQPEVEAKPEPPSTLRQKELTEILSVMPPSPTPSVDSIKEASDSANHSHIYDNLPIDQQQKSPMTPEEEEICPSVATKPILQTIGQQINEQKARNLIANLKPEDVNGTVEGESKPPRPPPAGNDSKSTPRVLPPPPRPPAPPKVLQKSYTMVATDPRAVEAVSPVASPPPVQAEPIQMRANYANATTSLDRRKLYRSKAENRAAKRATLARPITMHETTFTVKQKHNSTSFYEEGTPHSRTSQKIVFEQRDSITLPKFLLGSKKKTSPAPVARPMLATTPTSENGRTSALKSIATSGDDNIISPTAINSQFAMAPPQVSTVSIGVQTAPQRPKAPLSSIRHEESPLKTPPASPPPGKELSLPFVGERIFREVKNTEEGKSSLSAVCHTHRRWSKEPEAEEAEQESASEKLVNKCLEEYMAACERLRNVDLQGEFAAFHWQCGDTSEAGWLKLGVLAGCYSLEVYNDPSKHIDYVKLPPLQWTVGSVIYPESTIEKMLETWNDVGQSEVTPRSNPLSTSEPTFHPALAIIRLSDLLEELGKIETPPRGIRPSIALAVLLSIDQCTRNLSQGQEKAFLNLNPRDIILICSPVNSLVVFQVADSEGDWNIQRLLLDLYRDYADSLEVAVNACIKELSQVATSKLYFPALLEAIAPPDWVVQTMAIATLRKGESFNGN